MKRLNFVVQDDVYRRLEELKERTGAASLSEVFRDALRVYAWSLDQLGSGKKIAAVDSNVEDARQSDADFSPVDDADLPVEMLTRTLSDSLIRSQGTGKSYAAEIKDLINQWHRTVADLKIHSHDSRTSEQQWREMSQVLAEYFTAMTRNARLVRRRADFSARSRGGEQK